MTDVEIQETIEALVAEEHELLRSSAEEHQRLEEVRVELDRLWDLLRQRRAREECGLDPDLVQPRDPTVVEDYLQ